MKTRNKSYIIIIVIGLLIALGGYLVSIYSAINIEAIKTIYIGLSIAQIAGFFMLLHRGTFVKTKYYRILKGVIAIFILGSLFKIMHWPFSGLIITVGFLGIIITYLISFLYKPKKGRLDFLKLVWVITGYSVALLIYFHIVGREYQIWTSVLLWLMIIDYLKLEKEKGLLFK